MTAAIEDLAGALVAWLAERTGASNVTVSGFARPAAGQSSDNVLFDATFDGHVDHLVVRRQADAATIFLDPDVTREARVLQGALGGWDTSAECPMD